MRCGFANYNSSSVFGAVLRATGPSAVFNALSQGSRIRHWSRSSLKMERRTAARTRVRGNRVPGARYFPSPRTRSRAGSTGSSRVAPCPDAPKVVRHLVDEKAFADAVDLRTGDELLAPPNLLRGEANKTGGHLGADLFSHGGGDNVLHFQNFLGVAVANDLDHGQPYFLQSTNPRRVNRPADRI